MWQGKKKAITFSFDDGVTQDRDLVKILNDYGLKCTFNLNSERFGCTGELVREGKKVSHNKVKAEEVKTLYAGHEVAVHTLNHPSLIYLEEEEIVRQVEEDRKNLEKLVEYPIVGMAYPNGAVDERVAGILSRRTKIRYSRTVDSTHSFDVQKTDLLRYNPTVYYIDKKKTFELAEEFLALEREEDSLFYIWGHAYEMDGFTDIDRKSFEALCKLISGKADIFYGTNREVLLTD